MFKRPMRFVAALSLFAAVGLTACDASKMPSAPDDAPASALRLVTKVPSATGGGQLAVSAQSSLVQVVGVEGGRLDLDGHSLVIPAGAVDSDTEFTMTLASDEYIHVGLHAVRVSDGAVVSTFAVNLTLNLSYASANYEDPNDLLNAYLIQGTVDGELEPLPSSVDFDLQVVSSPLSHFSDYAMAID